MKLSRMSKMVFLALPLLPDLLVIGFSLAVLDSLELTWL